MPSPDYKMGACSIFNLPEWVYAFKPFCILIISKIKPRELCLFILSLNQLKKKKNPNLLFIPRFLAFKWLAAVRTIH